MSLYNDLTRRGLIAQMSHPDEIRELLDKGGIKFYIGFDATADSLHIGHLLQLITMRRFQIAGHTPFAVLGTGTTVVGDPSGKSDMRKMLDGNTITDNAARFQTQMERFLDFGDGKAQFVRNGDWLLKLNYLEFLRDVGAHFSVNKMLSAECFKARLEKGLSFLEFNYMLLQSYDFLELYRRYGVTFQMGGDDQWSNILAGADLIRRVEADRNGQAYALTFKLLLTKEGKKMGKTEKGALWLDAEKTPPYDFYQYFRNVADADVINCLKLLTFVDIAEIERLEQTLTGAELNSAKELLAYEVTAIVHGADTAAKCRDAAKSVFGGSGENANMPTYQLQDGDLVDGKISVLDLAVKSGAVSSKREARTAAEQGGLSVDGVAATVDTTLDFADTDTLVLRKGKKTFIRIVK
ncbi:MAG: tyrosine--tRNA ligase [Oscillospiraceae bacterium]|jgi:tyrosyl-tRNA synthetase|nr:tyrosine--tRNA ligase [Oscillospiraceae bacterium]